MRKALPLFFCSQLLLFGLIPAQAQTTSKASLYALQTTSFPTMTTGLDVFDSDGDFVTGLGPDSITLLEDNQPHQLQGIEQLTPGVKFALALDPGPNFAFRDANAVTRFNKVIQGVKSWTDAHADSLGDDLSFIPTNGITSAHLATTASFSDALTAYQPNLASISSSPDTLTRALDVVSESTSLPGMKPVVLYITSLPTAENLPILDNLTQRAVDQNIRVNVWIVASTDFFSTSGATALKDLAIRTSGLFVLFSGQEPLPSVETYLAPLRHSYRLTYSSGILTPGGHTLAAEVKLGTGTVTSAPLSFDLDIQPPNPILVSPPTQIVRKAPDTRTTAIKSFQPNLQPINIIIEFPDGRTRSLVRTTLFVDGQKVAENTVQPFDWFIWDLGGYTESGQHLVSVEVVDSFGLSKRSLEVPVTVTIVKPQTGLLPFLSSNSQWVALVAIFIAGSGVGVTLVRSRRRRQQSRKPGTKGQRDPIRQTDRGSEQRSGQWLSKKPPAGVSGAYLVRLKDNGEPLTSPLIPVKKPEMIFGSDPIQAHRILDDPSVSPLHARIKEQKGNYILSDEKSVSGTWVNHEQLTAPRRLKNGDVIHIGRVSYRFILHPSAENALATGIPKNK